jgi:hypothetical protein
MSKLKLRQFPVLDLCDVSGCKREYESRWHSSTHVAKTFSRERVQLCDEHALQVLSELQNAAAPPSPAPTAPEMQPPGRDSSQ